MGKTIRFDYDDYYDNGVDSRKARKEAKAEQKRNRKNKETFLDSGLSQEPVEKGN